MAAHGQTADRAFAQSRKNKLYQKSKAYEIYFETFVWAMNIWTIVQKFKIWFKDYVIVFSWLSLWKKNQKFFFHRCFDTFQKGSIDQALANLQNIWKFSEL